MITTHKVPWWRRRAKTWCCLTHRWCSVLRRHWLDCCWCAMYRARYHLHCHSLRPHLRVRRLTIHRLTLRSSGLQSESRRGSHVHVLSLSFTMMRKCWQRRIAGVRLLARRNGAILRLDNLHLILSAAIVVRLIAACLWPGPNSSNGHIIIRNPRPVHIAIRDSSRSTDMCRRLTCLVAEPGRACVGDSIPIPSSQRYWGGSQVNNWCYGCRIHGPSFKSIPYGHACCRAVATTRNVAVFGSRSSTAHWPGTRHVGLRTLLLFWLWTR